MRIEAKEGSQKELVRRMVEDACSGRLSVRKDSFSKKVWAAEVGNEWFIVKGHYPKGFFEKLKYLLLGSRSRREFYKIAALQERGLACAEAIGFLEYGGTHPSYLVLRKTKGTELGVVLPDVKGVQREEMLRKLGEYVRSVHSCGVFHGDLHPGNIFVEDGRFCLIDVQKTRFFKKHMPDRYAIRDVTSLALGIERACGNSEVLRTFFEGYFGNEEGMRIVIESLMRKMRQRRILSRSARCFKESTEFCKFRFRGFKIFCRRSIKEQAIAWVQILLSLSTPPDKFLKVRSYGAPLGWFRALLGKGELRRAWGAANRLSILGVPTVRHLSYLRRVSLLGLKEFLFMERAEKNFQEKVHSLIMEGDAENLRKATERVASFLNRLIKADVYHKDLKAQNILTDGDLLEVGDLGAVSKRGLSEWRVASMIAQLNASLPSCIGLRVRERVFLRAIQGTRFWAKRRLIWNTAEALSEGRKAQWVELVRREGGIKGG
ncbi:MAG: hypothetical protein N2234_01295 [Planctomycetota bacterium]|nr:hypothetical protein [Planctomycetota bacterium]